MSTIAALLLIVLPVFLVVGAGYGAVRLALFPARGVDALLGFATHFAVPALLFKAVYELDLARIFRPELLGAFYIAGAVCFAAGIALARMVWRRRPGEAVSVGFSALFSNSVLLGLPIVERAYGGAVLQASFAIVSVHAIVCYLLGILTMEMARRDGATIGVALKRSLSAMARNVFTVAIALGFLFNLAEIPLPGPVAEAIALLARAALPVALFALGGVLTRYALSDEIGEAGMVAGLSLVVHPLIAWALAGPVFGLAPDFVRAAVLIAAMPTGINGYLFAAMYNRAVGTAASAILLATAISVGSITVWLWLLGGAHLG